MFLDATSLIPNNAPGMHYGVAICELNRDGPPSLVVTGYDGPNRIFEFHEDRFEEVKNAVVADEQRQAIGVAAGDFDGDGLEELYILNTDRFAGLKLFSDRLFDFDGERWRDLFMAVGDIDLLNMTAGRSVCAIDRLGAGRYGFFIANYGGPMRLYELTEDGGIVDVAPYSNIDLVTGGRSLVSMPFVSPYMDLICGNEIGPNAFFRNRGDGTFDEIATDLDFIDPGQHARGMAPIWLGDAFGLVIGNWEGQHRLLKLNGEGVFENIAPPEMALPSRVRTVLVADFDNDGHDEIFFNNIGEPNRLFAYRNDTWQSIPIGDAAEPDGLGTGAAYGDFDLDGRLDLIIAHGELAPQPIGCYRPQPNDNHFLRVQPRTSAGAPARGAIVTVTAGERTWRRTVDAGSGYLCQMEPVAHFGLGHCDRVDAIAVAFPSGKTVSFTNHEVDCLIQLDDPESDS